MLSKEIMEFTQLKETEKLLYCYQSSNSSCPKENWSTLIYVTMYMFLLSGILITVCGNLVVIISISHFKQLHTPTNLLVLSMAVADFLLGLFVMPFSMVRTVETCWYFGDTFCLLHSSIDLILSTVSVFHLIFIAIDRYYAVCDPLLYTSKITMHVAWFFVTISWVAAIVYIDTLIYFEGNTEGMEGFDPCPGDCIIVFNAVWGTLDTMLTFFLPCSVMLCLYTKIFTVARRHSREISTMEDQMQSIEGKKRLAPRSKDRKATKTLSIVIGVFILCWLPYFVNSVMDPYVHSSTPPIVVDALQWLGYFNSGCNPIIYGFFYPWFQKALNLILTCEIFNPESSLISVYSGSH